MLRLWVLKEINSRFCSKTQWQMFLLVSGRHVGAHLGGHQHGGFIQISINLGKKFLLISSVRKIAVTWILARVFAYLPSVYFQILDLIDWTVFIFYFDLFWMAWHWKPAIETPTTTLSEEIVTLRWLTIVFLWLGSMCLGCVPDVSIDARNGKRALIYSCFLARDTWRHMNACINKRHAQFSSHPRL